jgi:hypothetical protein
MLTLSTRERETAYVYNYVVTGDEMRLKRLEGASERERKTIQWLLAKHVLISGYSKDVRLAGEIWSYLRDDGTQVLVVNANSGTYKPTPERLHAAAEVVSNMFGVEVETQEVPS